MRLLFFFPLCLIIVIKGSDDMNDLKKIKEEEIKILKTHQMNCIEETRVDTDLVIKLKAGDWKNEPPILKQWALCVLYHLGLMTRDGVFKQDEALRRISKKDQNRAEKLIDECLSTKAIPPQEIAWMYAKCHHFKDPLGNFSSITIIEPRW